MSIETWMSEFYPVPAHKAMGSEISALRHSILKWKGTATENAEKHGLIKEGGVLRQADVNSNFACDCSTCALCYRAAVDWSLKNGPHETDCTKCPIVNVTGKGCDGMDSPFHKMTTQGDPGPMIALLEKVLGAVLERKMQEFRLALIDCDWFYQYSDDSQVYAAGERAMNNIVALAKEGGAEFLELLRKYGEYKNGRAENPLAEWLESINKEVQSHGE